MGTKVPMRRDGEDAYQCREQRYAIIDFTLAAFRRKGTNAVDLASKCPAHQLDSEFRQKNRRNPNLVGIHCWKQLGWHKTYKS